MNKTGCIICTVYTSDNYVRAIFPAVNHSTKQLQAFSGATLYMVCRSKDRAEAAREEIVAAAAGQS